MVALADVADVQADLGRSLTDEESSRAGVALVKASALVMGHTRRDFAELAEVPEVVRVVTAGMVARSIVNSGELANVEHQNAGPFGVRFVANAKSDTPYLSAADKMMLRSYRLGGGLSSIALVSEHYRPPSDFEV